MLRSILVRARLALCAVPLLWLLAGCETIVDVKEEGAKATARAAAYQTNDRDEQVRRFGAYAKVADGYWIGTWFKGEVYAVEYRWIVPGVALEEIQHQGVHKAPSRFYWDPETKTLTRMDWITSRVLPGIRVEPGGRVAWPAQMGGIIDPFYVEIVNGAVTYRYQSELASLRPATQQEFLAQNAASNTQLREKAQREREESNARWDAFNNGLGAATSALGSSYAQQQQQQQQQLLMQQRQEQQQQQAQAAAARAQAEQQRARQTVVQGNSASPQQAPATAATKAAAAGPVPAAPPKPAVAAAAAAPSAVVAKAPASSCSTQDVTHPIMSRDSSEEAVRADIAQRAGKMCGGTGRLGEAKCSSTRDISIDAKGKQHDLGTRTHVCTAVLTCGQREVCRGGPSKASAQ